MNDCEKPRAGKALSMLNEAAAAYADGDALTTGFLLGRAKEFSRAWYEIHRANGHECCAERWYQRARWADACATAVLRGAT